MSMPLPLDTAIPDQYLVPAHFQCFIVAAKCLFSWLKEVKCKHFPGLPGNTVKRICS